MHYYTSGTYKPQTDIYPIFHLRGSKNSLNYRDTQTLEYTKASGNIQEECPSQGVEPSLRNVHFLTFRLRTCLFACNLGLSEPQLLKVGNKHPIALCLKWRVQAHGFPELPRESQ